MANDKTLDKLVEIKKGKEGYGLLVESDGFISSSITEGNKRLVEDINNSISKGEWNIPNPFILDVVMQKFDIENANGRIYPENILKREVEKYQRTIAEHMALGECNHPSDSQIDLGRISHNIVECHWEGHTLVGKISFNLTEGFRKHGICSSFGDTCANLILNGYKIGVSSRGVGSVSHKFGKTIVGDDFELICFDIVATPSTPGAYIGAKEELSQYVENRSYQTGKTMVNEKVNKLLTILND